jgi:hypothetical protein
LRNATPKGGSASAPSGRRKESGNGSKTGGRAAFNVQWDEEVESGSSSSDEDRAPKKRSKGATYDESDDESEEEMDAEQLRRK